MVVIGILATMMGLGMGLFGDRTTLTIKNESLKLVGTIKYVYNEAARKNLPYRIVFDVTEGQYWVESGNEDFLVTPTASQDEKKTKVSEDEANNEGQSEGSADFIAEEESNIIKKVTLKQGIKIKDVYVSHQELPLTEGQAHLFFFPNGSTEEAIIHFSDDDETINYSVIVNPVSGKSRIESAYISFEELQEP